MIILSLHLFNIRRPGGARIFRVFDNQLPLALRKLPIDRHLSLDNVRKVVSEADGYRPHLIAPEQGYRRLVETALNYFKSPAEASVDAVSFAVGSIIFSFMNYIDTISIHLQVHHLLKEIVRKSIEETRVQIEKHVRLPNFVFKG